MAGTVFRYSVSEEMQLSTSAISQYYNFVKARSSQKNDRLMHENITPSTSRDLYHVSCYMIPFN